MIPLKSGEKDSQIEDQRSLAFYRRTRMDQRIYIYIYVYIETRI